MCHFRSLSPSPARPRINGLSDPEKRALRLAAEGLSNEEIATREHRAVATVASHLRNAAIKLEVNNTARPTAAAVFKAQQLGQI